MAANFWILFALGAAIVWGLSYTIAEFLLQKKGMPPSFLIFIEAFVAIPFYIILAQTFGSFKNGLEVIFQDKTTLFLTLFMGFCAMLGNYFIVMSVMQKNATLTSFVEITYPIFTILFVWLFLKEFHLNATTAFGAMLIMLGTGVLAFKG